MNRVVFLFCLLLPFSIPVPNATAQILEDETGDTAQQNLSGGLSFDETDKNEALFNEMFGDSASVEEESSRFDSTLTKFADGVKKEEQKIKASTQTNQPEPLSGDLLIGVSKGSFKIFQNSLGRTACSFNVTLKSSFNKELHAMGMRLIYPHRAFAFIFRNVPANGSQVRFITTTGDICYNFSGVPDMEINLCRIKDASGSECAKRLKWDSNMEAPAVKDSY